MIRAFEDVGPVVVLLFPGAVLGIIASGNAHDFRTWAVVVGNFVFYFGLVYLAWGIRERYTRATTREKR